MARRLLVVCQLTGLPQSRQWADWAMRSRRLGLSWATVRERQRPRVLGMPSEWRRVARVECMGVKLPGDTLEVR